MVWHVKLAQLRKKISSYNAFASTHFDSKVFTFWMLFKICHFHSKLTLSNILRIVSNNGVIKVQSQTLAIEGQENKIWKMSIIEKMWQNCC